MIKLLEEEAWISWLTFFLIAGAIFYISSLEFRNSSYSLGVFSILYHFSSFFFLGFFMFLAILKGKKKYLVFVFAILFCIFYGITDELHQFFVPGRYCSLSDVVVDSFGIFLAGMIYRIRLEF